MGWAFKKKQISESFCWLLFIMSLASSLHMWYISFAAMAWCTRSVSGDRQVITPGCFLSLGLGFGSGFLSAEPFLGGKAAAFVDLPPGIYN